MSGGCRCSQTRAVSRSGVETESTSSRLELNDDPSAVSFTSEYVNRTSREVTAAPSCHLAVESSANSIQELSEAQRQPRARRGLKSASPIVFRLAPMSARLSKT